MPARIALATAARVADLDADDRPLLPALAARRVAATAAVWDDPDVDWASYDAVLLRSTWDYAERPADFLAWAERVAAGTRLLNPLPVLRWNTDKHYLRDLAAAGVPVVPTTFVEPGGADAERWDPPGDDYVVKPAVSAGSRDTARYRASPADAERARRHVAELRAAGRAVMLQPYVPGVDAAGETALVYVGGVYSHAAAKAAILAGDAEYVDGLYARETIVPREPSPAEREVAERAVAAATAATGEALLYARVDLLPTPGGPLLLELELTEPSLFLATSQGAHERLVDALLARLDVPGAGWEERIDR